MFSSSLPTENSSFMRRAFGQNNQPEAEAAAAISETYLRSHHSLGLPLEADHEPHLHYQTDSPWANVRLSGASITDPVNIGTPQPLLLSLPRYPSGALVCTVDDIIELEKSQIPASIPSAISEEFDEPLLPHDTSVLGEKQRAPLIWKGGKPAPLAVAALVGCCIAFIPWKPSGVDPKGWNLLAIFTATIVALVLEPLPTGAVAMISATAAVLSGTLAVEQAFSAFASSTIWMIGASFFFARGFQQTGLGDRVANLFVRFIGQSTLGLSYGLTVAHFLLCPTMPSTSARSTGIFMPIVVSLSKAAGSFPGVTADRMGRFLALSQVQAGPGLTSLFLTGAAPNALCMSMAVSLGVDVGNVWVTWFVAASVPGLICAALAPYLVYRMVPPELKNSPEAPALAATRLREMGPLTWDEIILISVMSIAVALWIVGAYIGVSPAAAALLGLSLLLLTGVLQWKDCLGYTPAWDTLTWFSILVGMSEQLKQLGVIDFFAQAVTALLEAHNIGTWGAFALLHAVYFLMHYMIASQTAHVGALYSAFLSLMLKTGVPGKLAAFTLAFSTNLFGGISTYSSAQSAGYYGTGYIPMKDMFVVGGLLALMWYAIFAVVGGLWWKALGWF